MLWSPFHIEIVLHHHCSEAKFPRWTAPAYELAVEGLISDGILEVREDIVRTTAIGAALVDMWRRTPVPVVRYVDPRFDGKAA